MAIAEEAERRGLAVAFLATNSYAERILTAGGYRILDAAPEYTPYIIRDFRDGSAAEEVKRLRDAGSRLLLLDELGEARRYATIVTDAFMTPNRAASYVHSPDTSYLYGLAYAPLRRRFMEIANVPAETNDSPGRLCITFGGSDPRSITRRFLGALDELGFRGPATVVADGTKEGFEAAVKCTAAWLDTEVHQKVHDMASVMKGAGLVATKIGVTLAESFALGIGCVLIEPSMLHVALEGELASYYQPWPALEYGLADEVDFSEAARATMELLSDADRLQRFQQTAAQLVDGRGILRLLDELTGSHEQ
jgi:spore coat polysaccharide biosynthesis predicted glycosyltransferase SpsG